MAIDKKFIDQFINVTSRAAYASSFFIGKKDKIAADKAAVDSMRSELNKINMTGEVVIGEGSLDEAPMLYTGEILGTKNGPDFDIAVDPVEGTNFVANNLPGGITVLAIAEKGNLFNAPETYMNKIATGKIEKVLIVTPFGLPLPASKARLVGFSGVPRLLGPASCVLMSPADDSSCEMLVASQTVTMADEIFSPVLR